MRLQCSFYSPALRWQRGPSCFAVDLQNILVIFYQDCASVKHIWANPHIFKQTNEIWEEVLTDGIKDSPAVKPEAQGGRCSAVDSPHIGAGLKYKWGKTNDNNAPSPPSVTLLLCFLWCQYKYNNNYNTITIMNTISNQQGVICNEKYRCCAQCGLYPVTKRV